MILLLVGIVLTILMVFITRQLTNSLPPERFRIEEYKKLYE